MRQSWISWFRLITGNDPPEQRTVKGLKSIARNSSSASTHKPWSKVMLKPLVIFTSAAPLTCSNPALSQSFFMFEKTALTVNSGRYCRRNKFRIWEGAMLVTVCYLCKREVTLIIAPIVQDHSICFKRWVQGQQSVNYKLLPGCNKGLKVLNYVIPEFITGKLVVMWFWLVCGVYNTPHPPSLHNTDSLQTVLGETQSIMIHLISYIWYHTSVGRAQIIFQSSCDCFESRTKIKMKGCPGSQQCLFVVTPLKAALPHCHIPNVQNWYQPLQGEGVLSQHDRPWRRIKESKVQCVFCCLFDQSICPDVLCLPQQLGCWLGIAAQLLPAAALCQGVLAGDAWSPLYKNECIIAEASNLNIDFHGLK